MGDPAHEIIHRLTHTVSTAARALRVRSALNPMLWLCAIATPILLVAAWMFREHPTICGVLITVAILPPIVTCIGFGGFAVWRPGMLQSEEYQLRLEALGIIQQKAGVITVDPASLQGIANPMAIAPSPTPGTTPSDE